MPAVDPKSPLTWMGAGGAALFVCMLLPWYGIDLGGLNIAVDTTANAWKAFDYTDILLFLASVAGVAGFFAVGQNTVQAENAIRAASGLGALCTLLVVYRIVNQPGPNDLIKVKVGAFLGLIAVAVMTVGAVRTMLAGPGAR